MKNEMVKRGNPQIAVMRNLLQGVEREIERALPRHMTSERMIRIALTAMSKHPKLLQCTPESLVKAVIEASELGLEPSGVLGHAYLIPYGNKLSDGTWVHEAQLQVGYRGFIELAGRSGQVESIYAEVVYDCDTFEYEQGLHPILRHVPDRSRGEDAKLDCAYAVAKLRSGTIVSRVMLGADIAKHRRASKSANSADSPWKMWPEEMWRKTAIRALAKVLPLSPELSGAAAQDERVESGFIERIATPVKTAIAELRQATPEPTPRTEELGGAAHREAIEPALAGGGDTPSTTRVNEVIASMMKYGYNEVILGSLLVGPEEPPLPADYWNEQDLEYLADFAALVERTPKKDRKSLPSRVISGEVPVGHERGPGEED